MLDHVRSPYGPREFGVTGDPRHWPCGTGIDAQADEPQPAHAFAPRDRAEETKFRLAAMLGGDGDPAQAGAGLVGALGGSSVVVDHYSTHAERRKETGRARST